jgi:hypothetical protein
VSLFPISTEPTSFAAGTVGRGGNKDWAEEMPQAKKYPNIVAVSLVIMNVNYKMKNEKL